MGGKGAVAAGHRLTAGAAEAMLLEGGNAFDAALAAVCAACVVEPVLCSLGGGGFMLARTARGEARVFDFFVQTPRDKRPADDLDFFPILADFGKAQQEFHIGLGSVATPGLVRGLFDIHRRLGSMPMVEIMAPAIGYAREGVVLNALQAYIFSIVAPIYTATPQAQRLYGPGKPQGQLVGEGDRLIQTALADLMDALAHEDDALFYRGEIARRVIRACQEGGGHLTLEDLERYTVAHHHPLSLTYQGVRFDTNPPPSSGGLLIVFALQLLERAGLHDISFGSGDHLRLLTEVMALTNKARLDAHVREGDGMLDAALLARYQREIHGRSAALRGTTHISVMDALGNQAAVTLSNGEGCGRMLPGTGVMLNNMLGEEDLNPGGFHCWQENQRMTSMMSPSLLRFGDGRSVALGSGGSNRIRSAILQVVSNLTDFDMDLESAVQAPRVHFENNRLSVEGLFDPNETGKLVSGFDDYHIWDARNLFFGGVHAVAFDGKRFSGVGDERRGGVCRIVQGFNPISEAQFRHTVR